MFTQSSAMKRHFRVHSGGWRFLRSFLLRRRWLGALI
jgi:hypothetical protein